MASPRLLGELEAVLARERFRRWLTTDEAEQFLSNLHVLAEVVEVPAPSSQPLTADAKDDFLVTLALATDRLPSHAPCAASAARRRAGHRKVGRWPSASGDSELCLVYVSGTMLQLARR